MVITFWERTTVEELCMVPQEGTTVEGLHLWSGGKEEPHLTIYCILSSQSYSPPSSHNVVVCTN